MNTKELIDKFSLKHKSIIFKTKDEEFHADLESLYKTLKESPPISQERHDKAKKSYLALSEIRIKIDNNLFCNICINDPVLTVVTTLAIFTTIIIISNYLQNDIIHYYGIAIYILNMFLFYSTCRINSIIARTIKFQRMISELDYET